MACLGGRQDNEIEDLKRDNCARLFQDYGREVAVLPNPS